MEQGDHSECPIELLACAEHSDEQLRRMGYEPGTSNMPHRSEETEPSIFADSDGRSTVGFCLWCNRDFHSMEQVGAHNADDMAACPVFQELHGGMPPVLQVMLEEPGLPSEHAEHGSDEDNHAPIQRLELGHIVATPGALGAMEESGDMAGTFLARHSAGDWGDLTEADRKENDLSLAHGFRLLSSYKLRNGIAIWVITEADRSSTCLLLPEEY
jgi:hypothetical protein